MFRHVKINFGALNGTCRVFTRLLVKGSEHIQNLLLSHQSRYDTSNSNINDPDMYDD